MLYDKACLDKFVDWVSQQPYTISILFTPWGEALIRNYYQAAIIGLSQLPNVKKVAIQTNLSSRLAWLEKTNKSKVALWTTYHPTEIKMAQFVEKCQQLITLNIKFSVGIVGKTAHFA